MPPPPPGLGQPLAQGGRELLGLPGAAASHPGARRPYAGLWCKRRGQAAEGRAGRPAVGARARPCPGGVPVTLRPRRGGGRGQAPLRPARFRRDQPGGRGAGPAAGRSYGRTNWDLMTPLSLQEKGEPRRGRGTGPASRAERRPGVRGLGQRARINSEVRGQEHYFSP